MVTIKTSDGKIYDDPSKIHIPRNEKTEAFYRMVESYEPPVKEPKTKDETA